MRLPGGKWRWAGGLVIFGAVAFLVIRTWVVPAIIVSQIRAHYGGDVTVGSWWLGPRNSGLEGLTLREGPGTDSPVWLSARRVEVDLSIGSILRGHFLPTRVVIDQPKVKFRLDAKGQPITRIPLVQGKAAPNAAPPPLPELVARGGEVTVQQDGREPMVLTGIEARLFLKDARENFVVGTDDPTWGRAAVTGQFDPAFKKGEIQIQSSPDFVADPDKLARIPFIPSDVWKNLEPKGPVDARVRIALNAEDPTPIHVHTEITLKGTTARLETLQVESTETTGRVVLDDAKVRVEDVTGKSLGGTISASGMLDFGQKIPRFDIDLRLKDVNVTKTPASWQLNELGATGNLSGTVDLKVALAPTGPDLSGTVGEAVISDGSFQGIPIKSLSIGLKAEGADLQYSPTGEAATKPGPGVPTPGRPHVPVAGSTTPARPSGVDWGNLSEPVLAALPIVRIATRDQGFLGWSAYLASEAVSFQVRHATPSRSGGLRLPKTVSTKIELEDVDLAALLVKAEKFGIKIPIPVAGKFSIKASATIPIGSLKDIKLYEFRGDATLAGASIDHVDVGLLSAHLELVDGVLDLTDFRGQLVDHPAGDASNPPKITAIPPKMGELPPGGFRANLRASISPLGPLTSTLEGRELPLGELFAPVLPVPTPISGVLTFRTAVKGDVAKLADLESWTLDATADSRRITYRGSTLDRVALEAHVGHGRVDLKDLTASLAGHPLKASGNLGLAAPYRFEGKVHLSGWEIADVLAFVPNTPRPAPASGKLDADARADGSLQPFSLSTQGAARVLKAEAGPFPIGGLVFQWTTDRDAVTITGLDIRPFGGKVSGHARIPLRAGQMAEANLTLKGIDVARISSSLPRDTPALSGLADGSIRLSMPLDGSTVEGEALLASPSLIIRPGAGEGVRVASIRVSAHAANRSVAYEATAESLGGKLQFHGSIPIEIPISKSFATAEFRAAGFRLNEVWRGLGIGNGLAELDGVGAVDLNLRSRVAPFQLWSRGVFELRNLHYGKHLDLGGIRGNLALTPTTWRIEELTGELLGGLAFGEVRSDAPPGGPRQVDFDFRVDRASLHRMLGAVPILARGAEGFGKLKASGQLTESLRATAEVQVPRGRVMGLPISDLRFPAEIELSPTSGVGTVHSRHWTARAAGGSLRGSAWLRLGENRSYQSDLQITGADLDVLSRLQPVGSKPISGMLSGKISLNGPDPSNLARLRGRVDLDLDDASLIELPVIKELDRFLGAARGGGGLFEHGAIHATIANRTLLLESMTLQGRLVQLRATGSVTLDGNLDLQVLVNTNDVIPQTGMALVGLIPGLGQALNRGEETLLRLAAFLENRLLKFRVSGNTNNPVVQIDTGIAVDSGAAGFFANALKLPGRR